MWKLHDSTSFPESSEEAEGPDFPYFYFWSSGTQPWWFGHTRDKEPDLPPKDYWSVPCMRPWGTSPLHGLWRYFAFFFWTTSTHTPSLHQKGELRKRYSWRAVPQVWDPDHSHVAVQRRTSKTRKVLHSAQGGAREVKPITVEVLISLIILLNLFAVFNAMGSQIF